MLNAHDSDAKYLPHIVNILDQFPTWREERLPPPRVSQSEASCFPSSLLMSVGLMSDSQYDKVGLTRM
jgi:proteasome activator subunit 4